MLAAARLTMAEEKDRGVIERSWPKQESFKSARKSGLYCHEIKVHGRGGGEMTIKAKNRENYKSVGVSANL